MTSAEKKAIYAALAAPFPEHCIQRTEGRLTGRGYDTTGIGYQHIANRLNEVLGVGGWRAHRTVTVKEITRSNGRPAFEAICDITLELGEWIDGQFIVFAESLADGGSVASTEADARKGATRMASRRPRRSSASAGRPTRAAWTTTICPVSRSCRPSSRQSSGLLPSAAAAPAPHATVHAAAAATPAPTRNRLTSKQLGALQAISRKLGMDHGGLRAISKQRFNAQPEFLTRDQASQLIASMSAQLNGNGQDRGEAHADEPGMEG